MPSAANDLPYELVSREDLERELALGGIGVPALQSLATRQVDANSQGQFQGVLASAVSLASIVAPLGFSSLYFLFREEWPGAIWLSVVAVYALAVPLVLGLRLKTAERASTSRRRGAPENSSGDASGETADLTSFPRQAKRAAILMTRLSKQHSAKP